MRSASVVLLCAWLVAGSVLVAQQPTTPDAERAAIKELVSLLSIPNVATDQGDIKRNADYLKQAFERRGFGVQVLATTHSPVVVGELKAPNPNARVITFYAHYDGQPVVASEWADQAPFQPIFRNGVLGKGGQVVQLPASGPLDRNWRVYGRSSSDDKGSIAAILAALDQVRAGGGATTSTIRFVFEGDEEAGSPVLEQALMADAKTHARPSDLVVFMDGPRHASGRPTFFFGARGMVSVELKVFGAKQDLHSGNYGNWAPNPALEMSRLLATMKDDQGNIKIAGFYDDVVPLNAEEKRAIAETPNVEQEQMRTFGFSKPEKPGVRLEELHNQPTFNISGIGAGTVTGQGRTIIPSFAVARMEMRLVKAIDPAKQFGRLRAHIEAQGYHLVAGEQPTDQERATYPKLARLIELDGYPAGRTPIDQPTAQAAVAAVAATSKAGSPIRYPTLGGSAPFYIFTDKLHVPTLGMPIANYDNNQHGPNENLQFGAFFDGIEAVKAILTMK